MSTTISTAAPLDLAALNDLLGEREVPPAVRATVLEAVALAQASQVPVLTEAPEHGSHVVLRPVDARVAAYVRPGRLDLQFDRRRALRTAEEYEFCAVEEARDRTDGWLSLRIDGWAVEQHAVVVRRLLLSAIMVTAIEAARESAAAQPAARTSLRRAGATAPRPAAAPRARAATPTRTATPSRPRTTASTPPAAPAARPAPAPAVCPVHFVQLVNGSCGFCD